MVTKAELESELEALKHELAAEKARTAAAAEAGAETAADKIRHAADSARAAAEGGKESLSDFLKSHGIDSDSLDIDALWQQLSDGAGDLTRKQPILAGVAVFALGFILGRASK